MTKQNESDAQVADENSIITERRGKLMALREQGVAFPNDFKPQNKAADLHAAYGELGREALEEKKAGCFRCRSHDAKAPDGQGGLCDASGCFR